MECEIELNWNEAAFKRAMPHIFLSGLYRSLLPLSAGK
jgi:hypothetical protein